MLASLFVPLDYMYAVYDQLYRAIRETYTTRTAMEEIRQINALFCNKEATSYATQAVLSLACQELARPPPSGEL